MIAACYGCWVEVEIDLAIGHPHVTTIESNGITKQGCAETRDEQVPVPLCVESP
jgi:hypothetical protein